MFHRTPGGEQSNIIRVDFAQARLERDARDGASIQRTIEERARELARLRRKRSFQAWVCRQYETARALTSVAGRPISLRKPRPDLRVF